MYKTHPNVQDENENKRRGSTTAAAGIEAEGGGERKRERYEGSNSQRVRQGSWVASREAECAWWTCLRQEESGSVRGRATESTREKGRVGQAGSCVRMVNTRVCTGCHMVTEANVCAKVGVRGEKDILEENGKVAKYRGRGSAETYGDADAREDRRSRDEARHVHKIAAVGLTEMRTREKDIVYIRYFEAVLERRESTKGGISANICNKVNQIDALYVQSSQGPPRPQNRIVVWVYNISTPPAIQIRPQDSSSKAVWCMQQLLRLLPALAEPRGEASGKCRGWDSAVYLEILKGSRGPNEAGRTALELPSRCRRHSHRGAEWSTEKSRVHGRRHRCGGQGGGKRQSDDITQLGRLPCHRTCLHRNHQVASVCELIEIQVVHMQNVDPLAVRNSRDLVPHAALMTTLPHAFHCTTPLDNATAIVTIPYTQRPVGDEELPLATDAQAAHARNSSAIDTPVYVDEVSYLQTQQAHQFRQACVVSSSPRR
ncbi:hypothetical protein C8R45DRAFT_931327 [Mycena sanguinolenta]|nr:hypothetical protein C8R45DRAFT_931327 [Mycena sanguinolenta]